MNKEEIISSGLLELYVLGIASAEEQAIVEQALVQYPEAADELSQIELSLEDYAIANSEAPPASLKSKIMAGLVDSSTNETTALTASSPADLPETEVAVPETKVYRIPTYFKLAAAAMLILLLGSIILNYSYYNRYQETNRDLAAAERKVSTMDSANLAMNSELDLITDKNATPVVLNGTPHSPDALAKIFWLRTTGDVYVDPSNLPAVPAGKQYQLWAIVDGKPVDAGMISTQQGTYRIQKMKSFGKAEAFAITLEKEGGSETPTMEEMFVMSKI